MNQQKRKGYTPWKNGLAPLFILAILCFYGPGEVSAQGDLSFDSHNHQINANGSFQDYQIPSSGYKYLYLEARGADGGRRGSHWYTRGGGEGANIGATFTIGTGANQLAPGGFIRFVVGKAGENVGGDGVGGCSGGGGTGILYLPPGKPADLAEFWKLLIVAGGGGGAAGDCCLLKDSGGPGEIGTSGGRGGGMAIGEGTDGSSGRSDDGGGGGGAYSGSTHSGRGQTGFNPLPVGGRGGDDSQDGGFGFGGGGGGPTGTENGGGGGGGYSGGGGGTGSASQAGGGGGGGSYINEQFAVPGSSIKKRNGTTDNPKDGYALYRAAAGTLPPQAKQIRLSTHIDKCIDQLYGNTDNGATVGIWNCGATSPHQYWIYDGNFIRYGADLNKCIDLANGSTSNGAKIEIWDCQINNENTPHQQWVLDPGTGHFQLKANPAKCLTVDGSGNLANESKIQLWDCQTNNPNQAWLLAEKIILADQPDKCIDQLYGNLENGATVGIWNCGANSPHQFWVYDGNFIRYGADLNKCIDLANGDTSDGAKIQIWDCMINNENTPHQQWAFDPGTGNFRLKADPSKCLSLYGGYADNSNGNWLWLWECEKYFLNQTWIVE